MRGARASGCRNHLHQLHVCLPAGPGRTRLLYRMSMDFLGWTRWVPGIQAFWAGIAQQARPGCSRHPDTCNGTKAVRLGLPFPIEAIVMSRSQHMLMQPALMRTSQRPLLREGQWHADTPPER